MISFGFSTLGCPAYGVDQIIAMARENGYSGVEIRFLNGTIDLSSLPELSHAKINETRQRFEDAGVAVVGIGSSLKMVSLDPAFRAQQMEAASAVIAIAEGLGARYLRVFGGTLPPDQARERTLDGIAEGLSDIGRRSIYRGVMSLIETHDDFCRSASVLDLYRRGMSEDVGILWDTLHTHRHRESATDTWSQLGPRIRLVHVKDAFVATPETFDLALTGEGRVPIASFIRLLEAEGYDGFVNFEWEKGWHPEIAEPEIALPQFMAKMAELGLVSTIR
jgi:sugar phosphate isomerase/epimerase